MPVTSRGQNWEIRHSLWIAWTFTLGFFGWIAFFYVGVRARRTRWILWGLVYSVPFILAMALVETPAYDGALGTLHVILTLVVGIAGIAHAFWIRKEYLMRLDARQRAAAARDASLRSRVEAEYGGEAVQAARSPSRKETGTYSQLASIKETVALTPQQALDSAQAFLSKQCYRISQRKDASIFAQKSDPEAGPKETYDLLVTASPQPGGGVRIKVVGDDRRGIEKNKTAWDGWARNLPKKEPEAQTTTAETDTIEAGGNRRGAWETGARSRVGGEAQGPPATPDPDQTGPSASSSPSWSHVDLNASSEQELAALPGVGIIIAKRAVAVRESRRGFRSVEDFGEALGLKPHVVERIRPLVYVSPTEQNRRQESSGRIVDF